jgi:hypothetical protein
MPPDKPAEPETYVATAPLYYYNPGSGTVPQLVRRPGEIVTAEALAANPSWRGRVREALQARHAGRAADRPGRGHRKGA